MKRIWTVRLSIHDGITKDTYHVLVSVVAKNAKQATELAIARETDRQGYLTNLHKIQINLAGYDREGLVWPWRKVGAL